MTIRFALNLFRWHIGALDIRLDIDQATPAAAVPPKALDHVSDYFAKRWFVRHS